MPVRTLKLVGVIVLSLFAWYQGVQADPVGVPAEATASVRPAA